MKLIEKNVEKRNFGAAITTSKTNPSNRKASVDSINKVKLIVQYSLMAKNRKPNPNSQQLANFDHQLNSDVGWWSNNVLMY
jgi:hypothetical protein